MPLIHLPSRIIGRWLFPSRIKQARAFAQSGIAIIPETALADPQVAGILLNLDSPSCAGFRAILHAPATYVRVATLGDPTKLEQQSKVKQLEFDALHAEIAADNSARAGALPATTQPYQARLIAAKSAISAGSWS